MAKTDFSLVLDDIAAPKSADASIFIAGAREDHARRMQDIQTGHAEDMAGLKTVGFLGTLGTEIGKKVMTGQAEDEINSVLGEFAGGEQAADLAINENNDQLSQQLLDSAASDDYMGAQTVKHFTGEAQRFAEAQRQGVMTREEAVARIGSVVKKYSAMVPGWAGEFRKKAAELTGISNIDTYGIHKALTEKSLREKQIEKRLEMQAQLDKELASKLGIKLEQITPEARAWYTQSQQLALGVQNAENVKKLGDLHQEQVDMVNEDLATGAVQQVLAGMHTKLTQVHAAVLSADGPLASEEAQRLGSQVAAQFQLAKSDMIRRINGLTVGKNGWKREKADAYIKQTGEMFDNYTEFLKSADGMNWWKQKVKDSGGNADFMWNSFVQNNPNVLLWKQLGVARDYVTAWDALNGNKDEFARRFGKVAADTMERIQGTGMGAYNAAFRRVATGQTSIGGEHDPDHRAMMLTEIPTMLERLAVEGGVMDDKVKDTVANIGASWLDKVNVTNPPEFKKFARLMTGDKAIELWKQLDPMQRQKVLAPLFERLEKEVVPNLVTDSRNLLTEANADRLFKERGEKVVVKVDATGFMSVGLEKDSSIKRDKNAPPLGTYMLRSPLEVESFKRLRQKVEQLNAIPQVVAKMAPLIAPGSPNVAAMTADLARGINGANDVRLMSHAFPQAASVDPAVADQNDRRAGIVARDVPRNTAVATVVDDTVLDALGHAESGNNPDAVGDKGKAVGEFQMWEGAMEDAGFDPADRKDPEKSRQAAKAYLEMQLKLFDGDMTKALAAWNMGPGRFRRHLREHGDAWQEKLPKATQTLLKRFNAQLEGS